MNSREMLFCAEEWMILFALGYELHHKDSVQRKQRQENWQACDRQTNIYTGINRNKRNKVYATEDAGLTLEHVQPNVMEDISKIVLRNTFLLA